MQLSKSQSRIFYTFDMLYVNEMLIV